MTESSPLANGLGRKRVFELCKLAKGGEIELCSIVSEDELELHVSPQRAAQILSDRSESNLYFDEEEALMTPSDLQKCLRDDVCSIPDDMLLRALGPDGFVEVKTRIGEIKTPNGEANGRSEPIQMEERPRFHLHFGAGRLGIGLVVPAISASGIPFGIVQRPKRRWMELFKKESDVTDADTIEVSHHDETGRTES